MAPFALTKQVAFRLATVTGCPSSTRHRLIISRCQLRKECFVSYNLKLFCAHFLNFVIFVSKIVLGDPRTNQNPVILAFGILMFRWHNVLARRVQSEHPDWSDEDIFQRTRRLVIASLQVSSFLKLFFFLNTKVTLMAEHYPLRVPGDAV